MCTPLDFSLNPSVVGKEITTNFCLPVGVAGS